MENLVSTLEPLFLIGSFSFLQVTRTTIKSWMSSNFGGIPPLTLELAALERLKNRTKRLLALNQCLRAKKEKYYIFHLKINIFFSREILLYIAWACLRNDIMYQLCVYMYMNGVVYL